MNVIVFVVFCKYCGSVTCITIDRIAFVNIYDSYIFSSLFVACIEFFNLGSIIMLYIFIISFFMNFNVKFVENKGFDSPTTVLSY